MTNTQKNKIEQIVKYCRENNPNAMMPLVHSVVSSKISEILERKKEQIQKEL